MPTVLYVDDDRDFADLVELRLTRDLDCAVETVLSADAALDRLDDGNVACAVLDYRLPRMGGPELLAAVHERRPDLPVVFFSGLDDPETAADATAAGAAAFVTKSNANFETLAEEIRAAIGDA